MEKVAIYDTTLRDGMQAEGVSFTLEEKIAVAKRLDEFGIDYIEGGFPLSNPKEEHFFARMAEEKLQNASLAAFGSTCRASNKVEEDPGLQALLACRAPILTIVGKSWDLHVQEVLRCSLEENLRLCSDSVAYLKKHDRKVFFDAEHFFDGFKNNPEYAMKVLQAAADAGADALVLCETNGGCLPNEVFEITQTVCRTFSGPVIGIHTHNDSDCAVANSLAAVQAGARQVQGTINGLGERCGNANLCSIIPNLTLKMGFETVGLQRLKGLTQLSRFVLEMANLPPIIHLPYVGESAFAHKGGLHIDALRKNEKTYEHIHPSLVGNERRYLISELSGSSNVLDKLQRRKISVDRQMAAKILKAVQDLENEGYQFEAAEASFDLLVRKTLGDYTPSFRLIKYHVDVERSSEGRMVTEATVKLQVDGRVEHVVAEGDGPVNALDCALRKALEVFYPELKKMALADYKVRVVNAKAGTAAKVRVVIQSHDQTDFWGTVGVSENIIEASWLALVDSVEYKLLKEQGKVFRLP
ncbi:MAG TPA: citramalate synthase [Anaerohalosphaeraceae bacterium]|nr:citramalate synthase [Anaerohalosphaeraceae bacterium]HPB93483.1 citramalate synthase [Anaerohalosphaeraceae bacterium]HRT23820.1 citramalate synthase [Anaerohalosphaeraceae bacterium]HRU15489.1 citramalate synthase [Anaerohalosphaeraceae bacterium]